ncbi:DUF4297 family anti-phage-associated protein [Spirosoma foliorum]|uniref:DUF4297 domain-containing protein n=1 Tax=Spirosoma foliorum TaxID=2710596 RepID=A0A7G5GUT5_9BACT|nr:DUF4297 family anti-phage-associated protein [Spirosoma foliorum]QMW02627.1 hypothetical protein H3H32_32780 [Spirosoma foliorum]
MIRSAVATIKGYYYQFDTSIKCLLELEKDSDFITVEGIEDIDINTEFDKLTMQCKYLSKPTYNNSTVREPIELMLDHFREQVDKISLRYILYAHFTDEIQDSEKIISLDELKEILTYKEKKVSRCYYTEHGMTDLELELFLTKFKIRFGLEFNNQQNIVINKLCDIFNCKTYVADSHYYNNALRIIMDKAVKADPSLRIITRIEFLKSIDNRSKLFNEWYISLRSKGSYLQLTKNKISETDALNPLHTKAIIIGRNVINANCPELPLMTFIQSLIFKYYDIGSVFRNIKPLMLILDQTTEEILEIKIKLIKGNIIFNDGFEHISFNVKIFNDDPVINISNSRSKITKSSFLIKLISLDNFKSYISTINKPDVIFHFSKEEFYHSNLENSKWFDVKYCENLMDVYKLLSNK